MNNIQLTKSSLDISAIYSQVIAPSCGAISMFVGTTRNNFDGKKVIRLEYEAYEPMAIKALENIANEARNKFGVSNIAIHHRLGLVPVGEASVVIAISSPHRQESLNAVSFTIDTLKANVPIFKKEIYSEIGDSDWKENSECAWSNPKTVVDPDEPICESIEKEGISKDVVMSSSNLVQITAGAQEINRRISLFIKRKREQADVENLQDFCFHGLPVVEKSSSCARIDAQPIRQKGSRSHVKVHRVENRDGPQIQEENIDMTSTNKNLICSEGVQERIKNAEQFLGIDKSASQDVFTRLKAIEDRILYLETISPEYFHLTKGVKEEVPQANPEVKKITSKDIQEKMHSLEMQLQNKYGISSFHNN